MSEELPEPSYDEPPAADWYAAEPEPAAPRRLGLRPGRGRSARTGRQLSATSTRWVLAAVALGAAAAAGLTVLFANGSSSLHTQMPGGAGATGAAAGALGSAQPGDCLTWTKPDATDLTKVNCAQPHLFEVAGDIDLSSYPGTEFGPNAPFPDEHRFQDLLTEHCVPAVRQYLGGKFDPQGKFRVGMVNPGSDAWKSGNRTLRCGLQESGPAGIRQPIVGTVAGQDQSDVHDPGTCIGIGTTVDQGLPTGVPVDCAQPHAWEVVATVDFGPQFTAPPSKSDQVKFLDTVCTKNAANYLGSPTALRNKTLNIYPSVVLTPDSWLAGSHRVNCVIAQSNNDNSFATLVGSAKGPMTINGQAPVPPPALPAGRWAPPPLPGAAPPN